MTVEPVPARDGNGRALLLQGRIVSGDSGRLGQALRRGDVGAIVLNSPGGSVLEARDMARAIHRLQVPVVVPNRAVCASACFMLFAAARDRVAEPGAMIGVHSASVSGGNETMDTLGVTTLMAREAAQYGVPPAITGRMVTTAPGAMAWLSRAELEQMGTRIVTASAVGPGQTLAPGSKRGNRSDWTRGFERGQAVGEGGDCTAPTDVANQADYALGCASGQRASGARVPSTPVASGPSDWTRGFTYGRSQGRSGDCATPDRPVGDARDWRLGCLSGQRAAGG